MLFLLIIKIETRGMLTMIVRRFCGNVFVAEPTGVEIVSIVVKLCDEGKIDTSVKDKVLERFQKECVK